MKKLIVLISAFCISFASMAQSDSTLVWKAEAKKINDSVYQITANTTVPQGWYLYGNNKQIEGLDNVQFVFGNTTIHTKGDIAVSQTALHQKDALFENKEVTVYKGAVTAVQQIVVSGKKPLNELHFNITANLGKPGSFQPQDQKAEIVLSNDKSSVQNIRINSIDVQKPLSDCGDIMDRVHRSTGLFSVFLLGLLGGFIALFTPCVFPMIPVTVSFFTKKSHNRSEAIRNGSLYGLFIFLIYLAASLPFHLLDINPEILNNISTSPTLNIIFFVIFIVFAISFFGFFEISLPSSIASNADSKSGLSSIGGIFFMAVTLTIVSFSCTGPLLGTLLVGAIKGGAMQLSAGMAGFGVALGLPFALFAIFPNWLHLLPKSGAWMDTIKKVLAFVELALAFKFFSNADLVQHWGILKREVFFGLWIIVSLGLTAYLFGWLRLPHDYKGQKISATRKVIGVFTLLFSLFLLPGVTNTKYANISLLSGFPPPLSYSIYGKHNVLGKGVEANVMNDFDKALALSKQTGKSLLVDCTGWACVNCRKMEENVWTDPEVKQYIEQHYILVSLYVDDKKLLPAEEQIYGYVTKDGLKKDILTVGDKWATFEAENLSQNTQPLYAIINTKEELVNHPVGYTSDPKKYLEWLKCEANLITK